MQQKIILDIWKIRLTVTLDVFKYAVDKNIKELLKRLTVTLDVFK